MPAAWTREDERKYERIRQSSRRSGKSESRAKEIAARTVNRDRREEGRTSQRTTSGTGNPNRGYESRTREELYNIAKKKHIEGRSRMSKAELINALRD